MAAAVVRILPLAHGQTGLRDWMGWHREAGKKYLELACLLFEEPLAPKKQVAETLSAVQLQLVQIATQHTGGFADLLLSIVWPASSPALSRQSKGPTAWAKLARPPVLAESKAASWPHLQVWTVYQDRDHSSQGTSSCRPWDRSRQTRHTVCGPPDQAVPQAAASSSSCSPAQAQAVAGQAHQRAGRGQQPVAQVAVKVPRHEGLLLPGVPGSHRHILGVAPEGCQLPQRPGIKHLHSLPVLAYGPGIHATACRVPCDGLRP